uniref:Uncharacterized protein n=1 Tax=Anguilla anguilla TaxID=7936 RepID=A0A0E9U6P0_ANGAN
MAGLGTTDSDHNAELAVLSQHCHRHLPNCC